MGLPSFSDFYEHPFACVNARVVFSAVRLKISTLAALCGSIDTLQSGTTTTRSGTAAAQTAAMRRSEGRVFYYIIKKEIEF